jgi:Co/Zn/Cd efflux system component
MRLAISRIWCVLLGFSQFLIGGVSSLAAPPGTAFGWGAIHVLLPMISGITLTAIGFFGLSQSRKTAGRIIETER